MRRFAKIVQVDSRGQFVIPKEVRQELGVNEGTGFYLYIIENEGILLKIIPSKQLSEHSHIIHEVQINADKLNIKKENIDSSIKNYKKEDKNFENL